MAERITTLTQLRTLPHGAVLLSDKRNRKYLTRRVIQVHLPGDLYAVDGSFESHRLMRRNLPAVVLHHPESGGSDRG